MKLKSIFLNAAVISLLAVMMPLSASAGKEAFHKGSAITEYGEIATVKYDQKFSKRTKFKVVFDVSKQADFGAVNRNFNSLARFINMHHAAGVPLKNIKLALVIHGGASKDLTKQTFYSALQANDLDENGIAKPNATAALISALQENGVEIYLCGQTAAYHGIKNENLLPGVKMALSAMTAHALLQQDGYTLNPF